MTQTQIRQRSNPRTLSNQNNTNHQMRALPGDGLAASTLLQSNPTHEGQVYKLEVPFIYSISPTWLKRTFHYIPCLKGVFSLVPRWKKRYLIQIGKYIYRYQIKGVGDKMNLKGTPLPLEMVQCQRTKNSIYGIFSNNHDDIISLMSDVPSSCHGFFSITSQGETRYYAVSTPEESTVWINSIREGRQSCIEKRMGHDRRPYPESWRYIDALGDERCKRNTRIKERVSRGERRELEMMEFMGGASSGVGMNSGHYS